MTPVLLRVYRVFILGIILQGVEQVGGGRDYIGKKFMLLFYALCIMMMATMVFFGFLVGRVDETDGVRDSLENLLSVLGVTKVLVWLIAPVSVEEEDLFLTSICTSVVPDNSTSDIVPSKILFCRAQ